MEIEKKCCCDEGVKVPVCGFAILPKDEALLEESGYQKFPSGLIMQWGRVVISKTTERVNFPIPFPTACLTLNCGTGENTSGSAEVMNITPGSLTKTGFIANVLPIGTCTYSYVALGK